MLRTNCHCSAVSIIIPRASETVTNCNCSICRRYGPLWAYFNSAEVEVQAAPDATHEYSWGEKSLAFVRYSHCGCITHWRPLAGRKSLRMGVNIRNFEPEQIGPMLICLLDGAVTEEYVGELGVGQSGA